MKTFSPQTFSRTAKIGFFTEIVRRAASLRLELPVPEKLYANDKFHKSPDILPLQSKCSTRDLPSDQPFRPPMDEYGWHGKPQV